MTDFDEAQLFSSRLIEAMKDIGQTTSRKSATGVTINELQKVAGVTNEMARRYTIAKAIPDNEKMAKIAKWLGVRKAWLRDGEEPKRPVSYDDYTRLPADVPDEANESAYRRLMWATEARHLSRDELSRRAGVPVTTLEQITSSQRLTGSETIVKLAAGLCINPEWLSRGVGSPDKAPSRNYNYVQDLPSGYEPVQLNSSGLGESEEPHFVEVPFYDVDLSAGFGAVGNEFAHVEYRKIPADDLHELNMLPSDAMVCRVKGESMYPLFHDGDLVLLNKSVHQPVSNRVFAYRHDEDLLIKRFTREFDGSWTISSDNEDKSRYRDQKASAASVTQIQIIGQVVSLVKRRI